VLVLVVSPTAKDPAQASVPGTNGDIAFVDLVDGVDHVFTINTSGFDQKDLGPGSLPAWSPDGKKIAFVRSNRIYVMNANGSNATNLSGANTGDTQPAWSPEGARIAFVHAGRVWVMLANGTHRHVIASNDVPDSGPAWSPDGREIVVARCCFHSRQFGDFGQIQGMAPDGTHQRVLFGARRGEKEHGAGVCGTGPRQPDWSPSGDELTFANNADAPNGGSSSIHHGVVPLGKHRPFPSQASEGPVNGSFNSDPSWSPDGTLVVYTSINADKHPCDDLDHVEIHIMSACSCHDGDLTLAKGREPAWQPVPNA
jgi:TolB protein